MRLPPSVSWVRLVMPGDCLAKCPHCGNVFKFAKMLAGPFISSRVYCASCNRALGSGFYRSKEEARTDIIRQFSINATTDNIVSVGE